MEIGLQIILNSVTAGLLLSLVAIGFSYIFQVTKVFHLAHGAIYATGAFAFWWFFSIFSSWVLSCILSLLTIIIIIYLIEKTIYLQLNKKQTNQSISLIASMGLYIVITNLIALFFGNESKAISDFIQGSYQLNSVIITKIQILQLVISTLLIILFFTYLKISKSDLAFRAISDNQTISEIIGINSQRQRIIVFIIGSSMACVAAILQMLETGIKPQSGMSIVLTAAVIIILTPRLNLFYLILFSVLLIFLQNVIEWFLNAQWKEGITYFILLIVIIYKTEGIISYNFRKDKS